MIGVIAAMPTELEAVVSKMQVEEVQEVGQVQFHRGKIGNKEVVVALAGVGEISASMASTLLCVLYHPDCLINLGVAGGLLEQQKPGDLFIAQSVIQADFDTSALDGDEGKGKEYVLDQSLVEEARQIAEHLNWPYTIGTIATQDLFMARESDYFSLMERFPQAGASEMEGAAVAYVADRFKVPCIIIRTLSDIVHHHENPMEFSTFAQFAAQRAGEFLQEWIEFE